MNKRAILYHAHCADGFGAAWSAWRKFGPDAEYIPVSHGQPPPELDAQEHLYILDFAYPRDVTRQLIARHGAVAILDHHKTAAADLSNLGEAEVVFDNEKSGAILAWEYFHPNEDAPELLRYVMDRDLWLHQLPNSREVASALSSYPMDFEVWSRLDPETLAEEGVAILRFVSTQVNFLCDQALMGTIDDYEVPVVNASLLSSEIGEELLRRFPEAPFVVSYADRGDGMRKWSLRSRPEFDVSSVAKKYRNGGHHQAAGFETKLNPEHFSPLPPTKSHGEDTP